MFFPTWIDCFYLWKRRRITVGEYLARPVPLPAGHDINKWDVCALDRCLLRFYLDLSWIIGVT